MEHRCFFMALVCVATLLASCGQGSSDIELSDGVERPAALTAATLGEQLVLSASDYLAQTQYAAANIKNGARQAQICKACHSLDTGGQNMIGPALHGFFGSTSGTREGFNYSAVLEEAGFVWTPRALDAWLSQPGQFLPGNNMAFAGVMKQQDRDDLIAYLLEETSGM